MIRLCLLVTVTFATALNCCNLLANDALSDEAEAASKAENALSITVEPTAKSYKAGDPVRMVVTLANDGKTDLAFLALFQPYHLLRFEITDPNGDKVGYRGPKLQPAILPNDIVHLKPDASYSKKLDITGGLHGETRYEWFDLTKTGTYKLRITYSIHKSLRSTLERSENYNVDKLWTGEIVSNEVSFRVE